jgi:hypothetical protein
MDPTVIELVLFRPRPGVGEEALRSAAAESTGFLRRQEGFVRRELAVAGDTGEWADIVHWTDLASARRAAAIFHEAPEAQAFMALLDFQQTTLHHLRSVLAEGRA